MKKFLLSFTAVICLIAMCGMLMTGCGKDGPTISDDLDNIKSKQQEQQYISENTIDENHPKYNSIITWPSKVVINLNDYVNISFRGSDGKGRVQWNYLVGDEDRYYLASNYLVPNLHKYTIGLYDDESLESILYGDMDYGDPVFIINSENRSSELSNGDTVHFFWEINEWGLKKLKEQIPGVEFVWEDFDLVVSGLEAVKEFDPFDPKNDNLIDFLCEYEDGRRSGEAIITEWEMSIKVTGEGLSYKRVKIEIDTLGHEGPWSNGDQIKVTILTSDEELLEKCGVKLTNKTGYITIDWLYEPKD